MQTKGMYLLWLWACVLDDDVDDDDFVCAHAHKIWGNFIRSLLFAHEHRCFQIIIANGNCVEFIAFQEVQFAKKLSFIGTAAVYFGIARQL